jgi:hypothetical protein
MVSPQGQVAPGAHPHPAAPPCTDYDVAYFKAYSHIGVHEEMLKVFTPHSSHISSFPLGDDWADVFPDASAGLGFCFGLARAPSCGSDSWDRRRRTTGVIWDSLLLGVFVALAYKTT